MSRIITYGGGSIKKSGLYDKVINEIKKAGLNLFELSGIEPNPRIESVRKGAQICKDEHIDVLLAVGGGSTLDATKFMAAGACVDHDPWLFLSENAPIEKALPIVTILTLAATGSEMDSGGVITNLETKDKIGRTIDYSMGRNRYIGYLMSIPTRAFKDIKVGLDCANGSSSAIAKSVFDALGAQTHVINNQPDGLNINTNCGSTHIEVLQKYVVENGLDVGFAYDGDADRCIAVDEFGRVVNGDLILYLCGLEMKQKGELLNNTIVTTVMSNFGLYKSLDKVGIQYEKTAVGDKYVYENMVKNGHCIGGEQSGHIIFSKHATTGDGILTSLKIMETMVENKKTLAQLTEQVEIYPQLLINVRVSDKALAQNDPDVQKAVKEVEEALGDEGRILVRESGTEPVIRVMVEAQSDEICHEYVLKVVNKIKEKGYAVEK